MESLDQHFAEKYENDIQSLQNNENYLLDLIKNQTSILKLENQVLRQTENNIQRQSEFINDFVNQTNINMASMKSELEILSATTYINSASLTAYLLINSLRTFQEMLFNTLTNVYQGHVDVHLITPVHLTQQLNEISGNLPKTVSIPVDNYKQDIKDLYKLITVKVRVTESYFLFEARIPLVADEDYIVYKVIPLPVQIANNFTYIRISAQYIAVNLQKNRYISLTDDDLQHCIQHKPGIFLCKKSIPTYDLHSNNAPCEAKLLSHENDTPCDIERSTCKEAWIELHSPNSWLTTCCDVCTLRIVCNDEITTSTISTSSILTPPQGCVLQSKDLTIYAHRQYNSQMKMGYEFNVPTLDTSINHVVNFTYQYARNTPQSTAAHIKIIEDNLAKQEENESKHHTIISSHDVHQYIISYKCCWRQRL